MISDLQWQLNEPQIKGPVQDAWISSLTGKDVEKLDYGLCGKCLALLYIICVVSAWH